MVSTSRTSSKTSLKYPKFPSLPYSLLFLVHSIFGDLGFSEMVKIFGCLVRLWRFEILFNAKRPARIHFCRISRSRSIWKVSWLPRRTKRSNWSNFLEMYAVVIAFLIFENCSRASPSGQILKINPVSSIKNSFCSDWPTESVDVLTLLHCHNASTYFLLHCRLSLTLKMG